MFVANVAEDGFEHPFPGPPDRAAQNAPVVICARWTSNG
jgi:hypothetical protein